jgi:hypothetical protein
LISIGAAAEMGFPKFAVLSITFATGNPVGVWVSVLDGVRVIEGDCEAVRLGLVVPVEVRVPVMDCVWDCDGVVDGEQIFLMPKRRMPRYGVDDDHDVPLLELDHSA